MHVPYPYPHAPPAVNISFPVPEQFSRAALPRPPAMFTHGDYPGHDTGSEYSAQIHPEHAPHNHYGSASTSGAAQHQHPPSMVPGVLIVNNINHSPYPWELVPFRKLQDLMRNEQERAEQLASALEPSAPASASAMSESSTQPQAPVSTPARNARHASASPAPATPTPSAEASALLGRPAKGQCWGITKEKTRCTRRVKPPGTVTKGTPRKGKRADARSGTTPSPAVTPSKPATSTAELGNSRDQPLVISDDDSSPQRKSQRLSTRTRIPPRLMSDDEFEIFDEEEMGEGKRSHDDDEEWDEVYCYQHVKELNRNPGFDIRRGTSSFSIAFSDYLGSARLSEHSQALLRKCMATPPTEIDGLQKGYIYIYEVLSKSNDTHICLKVGRTKDPFRRIGQWRSRCQSEVVHMRDLFPRDTDQGLLSGADVPRFEGIVLSRKWERLVHIELQDIAERVPGPCPDCGSIHREKFMIPRIISPTNAPDNVCESEVEPVQGLSSTRCTPSLSQARGGLDLTRDIVQKWMTFVVKIAAPDAESGSAT